jgi:hypothetical protein
MPAAIASPWPTPNVRSARNGAALIALVAFAACGGGAGNPAPRPSGPLSTTIVIGFPGGPAGAAPGLTPQPCPSVFAPNVIVQFQPAPNSTGVNDGQNNVVFIDVPAAAPRSGWGSLTLNGVVQGALAPAAIPSPLPSGEAFLSAPITTPLKAQTAYAVGVTFTNGCGSPDSLSIGTFTTQ